MEGQNYQALSLEQCLLEPHHFGAVNLASLRLVIALNCAIVNGLSDFFHLIAFAIKMAGFASFAIAKTIGGAILTDFICIS